MATKDPPLTQAMRITDEEIQRRLDWLEFGEEDEARVRSLHAMAKTHRDHVIDDLYEHFLRFDEVREFFRDASVLEHVKAMQRDYFMRLTEGGYDRDYIEDRLRIGAVHARVGVDVKWYLSAYNHYVRFIGEKILEMHQEEPERALKVFNSLQKIICLDIGLALDTYIFQREKTIRMQQEVIRGPSTPVLRIREGLLLLPVVGVIDSTRALQLTRSLLHRVRDEKARVVVIDVTGVPAIDSQAEDHLLQTVKAAHLIGTKVILTGLSPETAQTLVMVGVSLGAIHTVGDLQGGIEAAEWILGYQVRRLEE